MNFRKHILKMKVRDHVDLAGYWQTSSYACIRLRKSALSSCRLFSATFRDGRPDVRSHYAMS